MIVPFLDVRAGNEDLRGELDAAYDRVVRSGNYILGEELERFEHLFAGSCDTRHAVGVGTGLDALTIALRAAGIGPGDEVIVPAHTFAATWLGVIHAGARLVPVDVDAATALLDIHAVDAALTTSTAAVIPVHLYGRPLDPAPLGELARQHGLLVIGDAAQAHGAAVAGVSVGASAHAAGFSFYPAKNLGALGDGGAITTSDDALARRARRLRNYGSDEKHAFLEQGYNSRLDPLQAAFLAVKLNRLDVWNARRAQIAEQYREGLADLRGLVLPPAAAAGTTHAWHVFCIRHRRRDELRAHLLERGIETQLHYPAALHRSAAFAALDLPVDGYPVAAEIAATTLSLPIGPHLGDAAVGYVVEAVRAFRS